MAVGDLTQGRHIARVAKKVDGDDGAGARRDLGFHILGVKGVGVVNVGKDRHTVVQQRTDDAAPRCPRGDNNLVARVGVDGSDTEVHGRGAGVDGNGVFDSMFGGKFPLKLGHLTTLADLARAQYFRHGLNIILAKVMGGAKGLRAHGRAAVEG